jgi:hypothetical protein
MLESDKIDLVPPYPYRTADIDICEYMFLSRTAYEEKTFSDSFLPDLPCDKPNWMILCQVFASQTSTVVLPTPGFPVIRRFFRDDMVSRMIFL